MTTPKKSKNIIIPVLIIRLNGSKFPEPKYPYRKHSNIPVKGFAFTIHWYWTGTEVIEYTTGVAYINNCIPKVSRKTKSLYFVVSDEKIIPNPNENADISNIKKGVAKTQRLG